MLTSLPGEHEFGLGRSVTSKFSGGHHDTKVMIWVAPDRNRPLELADNGAGVTPAVVVKATTPFYSTLYTRRQSHRARFDGLFSWQPTMTGRIIAL
ncbi:hypothetical protein MESS2_p60031 [Mesorhizobium metallidurans STM 2683]|uniref:Histidine kinase/HSP90-like ATPase domain-containing protein n=1 Tax=Mesorhizobium metallidurans STM 2683 TaxID=1297569 RepID=M5F051_9HYPH|nr:hypothetical protein MESS2_p60031 [Mesorhizobium metallidurans STM 2683]